MIRNTNVDDTTEVLPFAKPMLEDVAVSSFDLLFSKPKELNYINKDFDFEISPAKFIEWLKLEGEEVINDYKIDCSSMCEYSCLYIGMLLNNVELKGEMVVYYGKFGFWEHYWIGYKIDGEEYFIDLTLQQFVSDAPKLSITKFSNERVSGSYSSLSDGEPIKDYIERQRAFMFYSNPITMLAPVIYWNRFNQVLPPEAAEYLVCDSDDIIKVSYYNGDSWGYLASVRENITQ
jgi:hypothetical protein